MHPVIVQQVENAQWDQAVNYITTELFDKPNDYVNLDKLRRTAGWACARFWKKPLA